MTPSRKSKRQAKTPAKLDEFLCEENVENNKASDTRKSRRTPKPSEKIKDFLGKKVPATKEKSEEPVENDPASKKKKPVTKVPITFTTAKRKPMSPRVLLKPLPKSVLQTGRESTKSSRTTQSSKATPQTSRTPVGKTPAQVKSESTGSKKKPAAGKGSSPTVIARASPSASNSKAGNLAVKRKLEEDKKARKSTPVDSKRRKLAALTPRKNDSPKDTIESIFTGTLGPVDDALIPKVNKEILNKLIGFGAEIAEAIDTNSEAIVSLSDDGARPKRNISDTIKSNKSRDLTDDDVNAILQWLDDEENQRRSYRKRILESLRASHEINMALYNQMLQVLQSVTLSM